MYFHYFEINPLEKGGALHMNKLESHSPKDTLCQVWLKLAQWFWRRRWICEKLTPKPMTMSTSITMTTTTDNGQILIRKGHLSLWLRLTKRKSNKALTIQELQVILTFIHRVYICQYFPNMGYLPYSRRALINVLVYCFRVSHMLIK